jgi:hypothetical protein
VYAWKDKKTSADAKIKLFVYTNRTQKVLVECEKMTNIQTHNIGNPTVFRLNTFSLNANASCAVLTRRDSSALIGTISSAAIVMPSRRSG